MELLKELWFQNFIAILMLFIIPATLFIFPSFYIRITRNNIFQISFRSLLFGFLLWIQIIEYWNRIGDNPKNWHGYFYLEFCTIECWVVMYLLIHPNKLLLDCSLPMGIIGPVLTVFFGNTNNEAYTNHLFSEEWIHFFMGHIIFMFSYLYIYIYGFTRSKFNWTFVKRSVIYTAFIGLFVEIYNLAFDTSYIYQQVTALFIGNQDEIYNFIFCLFIAWPALFMIFYPIIWFCKPIYDKEKNEQIRFTWFEKIKIYMINKKTKRNIKLLIK